MKKVLIAILVVIMLIFLAKPINAQSEKCSLGTVNVVNEVKAEGNVHSKTTWTFSCGNATKNFGQMTKIIYRVPLTDIVNFEATDTIGTMKVLEGPVYATASVGERESILGIIFRKPLLITDESTSYFVTAEFDSSDLVIRGENGTFSIIPGKQLSNPKTTIITTGVTETTEQIGKINYELSLPTDASVQTLTAGCTLTSGKVSCQNLNQSTFNSLEIKWQEPEGIGGIIGKIKQNIGNMLPGVTNIFKGIGSSLSKLIKGK